ncbi:DUF4214 domain-containing protein, partial [Luminiphilus sp.]|nr:DUF4214 domain-containing protein [Luminiphilus sp.]
TSVGGDLYIIDNDRLTNLDGLANITSAVDYLSIYSNDALTNCQGLARLLGWPPGPSNDAVGRDILIERNRTGCNSIDEIFASVSEPTKPSITSTTSGLGRITLRVAVSENGGGPIDRYDASCTDGTNTYTGTSATSPITISGLTNDVTYTCTVTATNSVGTSPASAPTDPIICGDEAVLKINNFVVRFYTVVLGRLPDQVGLDGWVAGLTGRTLTGSDLARGFFLSPEYTGKNKSDTAFLDDAYLAYFDRAADAGGKQGWLDALAQGMTRTEVLDGFSGSQEFIALATSFGITPFAGYCVPSSWNTCVEAPSRLATQESTVPNTKMELREGAEAKPIPTLSVLNLGILTILLSLFGLLGFRSKTL